MLYQKIRPTDLSGVVGNSSTVGALQQMLRRPADKRPHTIILKGPLGCGKTTLALILAKEFGADEHGIIRYNAANTRGIETAREIESGLMVPALDGKPVVYIIDESQQMLKDTQEALLHATEDTPDHAYFIWCSSAPERIIAGIHSRATEYEVGPLGSDDIQVIVGAGVKELGIDVHTDILEAIPLVCNGSPREALVMLEQVADMEDVDAALDLLERGTERDKTVLDLMKLMIMNPELRAKRWQQIITTYNKIDADSERTRRSLSTFLYNRLVKEGSIKRARDIVHLLKLFSTNTYYGGKAQLGTMVARACFEAADEMQSSN